MTDPIDLIGMCVHCWEVPRADNKRDMCAECNNIWVARRELGQRDAAAWQLRMLAKSVRKRMALTGETSDEVNLAETMRILQRAHRRHRG